LLLHGRHPSWGHKLPPPSGKARRLSTRPVRSRSAQRLLPLVLVLTCVTGASRAQPAQKQREAPAIPGGVVLKEDLTYCTLADGTALQLDLACPRDGKGPFPTVLFLHGGGWVRSDRKEHLPRVLVL